jgi:chromosome segregation ATPase
MSPRGHLVAAISELKEHLATTRQQIPLLEGQLQTLRTSQDRLQQDLAALEGALSAIDGANQTELPVAVPPIDAVPAVASESVPRPPAHRRSVAGAARA